jgi:hypothetical protein
MSSSRLLILAVCAIGIFGPTPGLGDVYDCFDDGFYQRDPNDPRYDANEPYWTDPNNAVLWDSDNPDWTIRHVVGSTFYSSASDGWLRLFADEPVLPYAFIGATVEDGNPDPNTSITSFDDSAPHYLVARMRNYDPCAGEIVLTLHGNYEHWTAFMASIELEWIEGGPLWEVRQQTIANLNGTSWGGAGAAVSRTDLDNEAGFWMAFQWDGDGDPNHSYARSAAWNGAKFAWDGVWDVEVHVVTEWDPNDPTFQYWGEGVAAVAPLGAPGDASPGHADAKFDGIECRWGTFTNVSHTLKVAKIKSADYGTVTIDPDLLDDSNNIDPNEVLAGTRPAFDELRRYTAGTEVTLVADPAPERGWKKWKIWNDPNRYPDPNYEVSDTNTVIYLTMDRDYVVEVIFSCSASSALPPMVILLLTLSAGVIIRRLS